MPKISFVIPIYNEAHIIEEFYRRLKLVLVADFSGFSYEIIFIDDGSVDESPRILEKLHVLDKNLQVIQFSRNFGHHIALTAGSPPYCPYRRL